MRRDREPSRRLPVLPGHARRHRRAPGSDDGAAVPSRAAARVRLRRSSSLRERGGGVADQRRRRAQLVAWAASLVAAVGLGWGASSLRALRRPAPAAPRLRGRPRRRPAARLAAREHHGATAGRRPPGRHAGSRPGRDRRSGWRPPPGIRRTRLAGHRGRARRFSIRSRHRADPARAARRPRYRAERNVAHHELGRRQGGSGRAGAAHRRPAGGPGAGAERRAGTRGR